MNDTDLKEKEESAELPTTDTFSKQEEEQLGKGYTPSQPKQNGGLFKSRKGLLVSGGLIGIFGSVAIGFLMFMTVYRVEHVRNLLWDFRFARFHGQVARRIRANILVGEGISPSSPEKIIRFKNTSLYDKFRGYSPAKAFSELSGNGLLVEVEKKGVVGFRENRITGFSDPISKEKVFIEGASNIPEGAEVLKSDDFAKRLKNVSTQTLERAEHSKYFQRQTRKLLQDKVKIRFGDRYQSYKEKLRAIVGDNIDSATAEQEARALAEADLEVARGGSKPVGGGLLEGEEGEKDLLDGIEEPDSNSLLSDTPEIGAGPAQDGIVKTKFSRATSTYANASTGVMVITFSCILKDISGTIDGALAQRIEAPMRLSANIFGEAEQLKSNDKLDIGAIRQRSKSLEGSEKSAAFHRIDDDPNISPNNDLQVDDLPLQFFGMDLKTVSNINKVVDTTLSDAFVIGAGPLGLVLKATGKDDEVIKKGCSYVLNPYAQAGIAAVDVGVLIFSLGSSAIAQSGARAALEGLKAAVQVGASVGINKVFFEYLIPKLVFSMSGSGGLLRQGDPQNGNKLDLGTTLLAAQVTKMSGGTVISDKQARRDNSAAFALAQKEKFKKSGNLAYFDLSSPYSLPGIISMKYSSSPAEIPRQFLATLLRTGASIFSGNFFSNLFTNSVSAETDAFTTYGVPQYGIPDSMIDVDPIDNAIVVDTNPKQLETLLEQYGHCFDTSIAQQELSGLFNSSSSLDFSICNNQTAQQLGLYIIDNCAARFISSTVTSNNCSLLNGAGDLAGE